MISTAQAFALRRLALGGAALASTLVAHGAATGHVGVVPAAPALWGWLLLAAALLGRRRGEWRRRRPATIFVMLLGAQLALHVAMSAAPWAFGLEAHHAQALLTPGAVAAHLVAACLLTVVLAGLERVLAAAQSVVAAVRAALAPVRPRGAPSLVVRWGAPRPPATPLRRAASARGPPPISV